VSKKARKPPARRYRCPLCAYAARIKKNGKWRSHIAPGTIRLCPASGKQYELVRKAGHLKSLIKPKETAMT
jgi:rubredoxin